MTALRNDPHWINARFGGHDANGRLFAKGDRVFFYPLGKRVLSGDAAEQASREFESARQDEDAFR